MLSLFDLDDEITPASQSHHDDSARDDQSFLSGNTTIASASSSQQRVMALLNRAFELDDEISQQFSLEDIKSPSNSRNVFIWDYPKETNSFYTKSTVANMTLDSIKDAVAFAVTHWKILVFGQFISIMMSTGSAAQASLHFDCHLSAPLFCSSIFFVLLSLLLIPIYARGVESTRRVDLDDEDSHEFLTQTCHGDESIWFLGVFPLKTHPWRYALIAFLNVQAYFCTILAFTYTPMTSVSLFASLAVPSAMIISKICLGRVFGSIHVLGVLMCMVGVVYNVIVDHHEDLITTELRQQEFPHRLFGDILAIMGGILFGIVDVVSESALKTTKGDPTEFLGMIGFFASWMALLQGWLTERDNVIELYTGGQCSASMTLILLLLFVTSSAGAFIGRAYFLSNSEATLLNLSILTDQALWSVLFTVFAQRIVPPPLFWAASVFVVGGILVYFMAPSPCRNEDRENDSSLLIDDFDNRSDAFYSREITLL